ncbi:MAG: AAA family ATPase, partial [Bacteroidetes bacterium]|nr:AAA family ATPase [Bacteroidota bacterium]
MELIKRIIEDQVIENLTPQKVIILLGPRRVGKTILIKQVLEKVNEPYLLLNGEDFSVVEILERR